MASFYAVFVTEDEARKKWCPLVRYLAVFKNEEGRTETAGAYNRGAEDSNLPNCIASQCMAWRKHGQIGLTPEGKKVDRDMDVRTRWTDVGYCGAFGHPDPGTS